MTPEEFRRAFAVSRETLARLEAYVATLERWSARMNLIGPSTRRQLWHRHLADSAQLLGLAPKGAQSWIDLGSGAGLPGLVVAALAPEKRPRLRVTLVESSQRKCAFLAAAARAMGVEVEIACARIEELPRRPFDVVSARALAPLPRLCALASRFVGEGTIFLFPKGASVDSELTEASRRWHIRAERIVSRTSPEGVILRIGELAPRT